MVFPNLSYPWKGKPLSVNTELSTAQLYGMSMERNEDQGRTEGESTAAHPSIQVHLQ